MKQISRSLNIAAPDVVLIGGSTLITPSIDQLIIDLKRSYSGPIILFPGSGFQLSSEADGLLFLSLISGRNPDLLIGKQVESAALIRSLNLPTRSCGYILIDGGRRTSVQYMTQTQPIPRDKPGLATATGLAGEMLGLQSMYLEAGSGAQAAVPVELVASFRTNVAVPLIIGGGIRSVHQLEEYFDAGANVCVIGTLFEEDPTALVDIMIKVKQKTKTPTL